MTTMLERVARALAAEAWGLHDLLPEHRNKDAFHASDLDMSIHKARAAIRAMREPDEGMLKAIGVAYSRHNKGDRPYEGEALDYWQAAIDAATQSVGGVKS